MSYTPDIEVMFEAYRFHARQVSDRRYIELGVPVMTDDEIRAEFDRFIATIKAEALRGFADELATKERLSVDDALTVGALRARADDELNQT